jgi:predicted short-subunit dehydrogenase-like oxidoreductase (DUF2520 family)
MASVAIAGTGRTGLALTAALGRSGAFREIVVFGRHARPPGHPALHADGVRYVFGLEPLPDDAEALFLALPEAVVPEIAFSIAALGPAPADCAAFHLSGTLPTDVLAPLFRSGYGVGSFRPLTVFTDPVRGPERFRGAYVAVTAAPEPLRTASRIAETIGARAFPVPAVRRPLFDAAVSLAEGALVPVVFHTVHLLERAGVDPDDALPAVVAFAGSVLDALEEGGDPALSGPIGRGDHEAIALHLRALGREDQRLYALRLRELLRLMPVGQPGSELDERVRADLEELLARYVDGVTTGAGVERG